MTSKSIKEDKKLESTIVNGFIVILAHLYRTQPETWNFERAKTARIDSSEFSRGSKSKFQAGCSIYPNNLKLGAVCFFLFAFCSSNGWGLEYNLVEGLPNVHLTPASEKIGVTWVNGNVWDKPLIQKFYSVLAEHKGFFVVLDFGAQTGSFSLLAKYFPNSQWYAFEPIQEAADTLHANLRLNDIHNVSIYPVAVSDCSGRATLKMPNMDAWGLSTMGSNVLRFAPVEEREVECVDLDSFAIAHQINRVHFMKLDTEGWEYYILKGAEHLIRRDHPIILMEYNETNMNQCNSSIEKINLFLNEMGYEWKLISSEDILCIPKQPQNYTENDSKIGDEAASKLSTNRRSGSGQY